MGVYPNSWMVYFMENPTKMDDLEVPLFLETSIYQTSVCPMVFPSWLVLYIRYFAGECSPNIRFSRKQLDTINHPHYDPENCGFLTIPLKGI